MKNRLLGTNGAVALLTFVLLVVATTSPLEAGAPNRVPAPPTLGANVVVGSFEIQVKAKHGDIKIKDRRGKDAATVPSTDLLASFIGRDRLSEMTSISVAIQNEGAVSLFGPLRVVITEIKGGDGDDDDLRLPVVPSNPDTGVGPGSWSWVYGTSQLGGATLAATEVSGGKRWDFIGRKDSFKFSVQVLAGVPLAPGLGATIEGLDGTSITVQPDSIPYEVLIDINSIPSSGVNAPLGDLAFVGAVKITFEPVELSGSLASPSAPLQISIPTPANPTTSAFVVGQQILVDSITGSTPGLLEQLVAVDTASLVGNTIQTEATVFPGIFGGGLFVFVANTGSGFATGTVFDLSGPQAGVVVSSNTNPLVSITNGTGRYTLFINGGPFTVTGFHPFKGTRGFGVGVILFSGSTVSAPIFLLPDLPTPLIITRDGVRNAGFERGDLSSWGTSGAATAAPQLGPTSTGVVIRPTEGGRMADINTGAGSVGGVGSSLKQRFRVPAGVRTLRLDFNFVSEEFPEFVGSIFDDSFNALITTPDGQQTFERVSVNDSGGFFLIGDCGFPGGDSTCGQTGWRQASVDLSQFQNMEVTVELLFTANDAGDNIYDTHVLLDNIRFSTVTIDAKIIAGAADADAVRRSVVEATEILSQAGINVELGLVQEVDVINLLIVDGLPSCNAAEIVQLVNLSRSAATSDINAYYVRRLPNDQSPTAYLGVAATAEDCPNLAATPGLAVAENRTNITLAHEIGHLLIAPETGEDPLEHCVGSGNFLSGACGNQVFATAAVLTRAQSKRINRLAAPFLTP